MEIQNFKYLLEKRNFEFQLGPEANDSLIRETQKKLNVVFPDPARKFFNFINGLEVKNPKLKILPLRDLVNDSGIIVFSIFDEKHLIGFDTNEINDAEQWDIINVDSFYLVTLSISSFWSNKIWAWLNKKRPIWQEETYS